MKPEPKYNEPHWIQTILMEALFIKKVDCMSRGLSLQQMGYILGENDLTTSLVLNHLKDEGFFKLGSGGWCLSDQGIFHAKLRKEGYEEGIREGKVEKWHQDMVFEIRDKFLKKIDDLREERIPSAPKNRIESLERRIKELEDKFEKLKEIL